MKFQEKFSYEVSRKLYTVRKNGLARIENNIYIETLLFQDRYFPKHKDILIEEYHLL